MAIPVVKHAGAQHTAKFYFNREVACIDKRFHAPRLGCAWILHHLVHVFLIEFGPRKLEKVQRLEEKAFKPFACLDKAPVIFLLLLARCD
jgi:hypothetical protein